MNETFALAVVLTFVVVAVISWAITYFTLRRRIRALEQENSRLQGEIEVRMNVVQEKEELKKQLAEQFSHLSGEALERNNRQFLQLAEQNLKQYHEGAKAELSKREQAIEGMVRPIREALTRTEQQIQNIEKERKEAFGSLVAQLRSMAETQSSLQTETSNLVQALRRPEVRGQWGELTLRRVVELAGMVEHCDFYEQESAGGEGTTTRPDMIVRMPDAREIVVDAKTPLDAYISGTQSSDTAERKREMERFGRHVREKVRELAGKAYWSQFSRSPEFVVLFIPGEQFLGAALDVHPDLQEEALRQKVILATPNNLVALLKTIAFGWRQQAVAENAEKMRQEGTRLYERVVNFTEHLSKLGTHLRRSVDSFNSAVGSLEHQLLPGARKFTEMGIQPKKTLAEPEQVDVTTRAVPRPDSDHGDGEDDEHGEATESGADENRE
ncbi:MAG: DNA recombination protein RmuC [Halofilum sp. (in: g-proteobacteria)]|nr:DNA recombination protein RmuC [Halofilum sp. (in: g-proteobacteria)]